MLVRAPLLVCLLLVGGCSAGLEAPEPVAVRSGDVRPAEPADRPAEQGVPATVFVVDIDDSLTAIQQRVPTDDGDVDRANRPADRVRDAVRALLAYEPVPQLPLVSWWDDRCAPGDQVAGARVTARLVTVRLTGPAGSCDLTDREAMLQRQQLALTVVRADPSIDPATPVRLRGGGGARVWPDTVADPDLVGPG